MRYLVFVRRGMFHSTFDLPCAVALLLIGLKHSSYQLDHYSWRLHVAYWVINVVGWVFLSGLFSGEVYEPLVNKLCYLPSQLIVTYALVYIAIPSLIARDYVKALLAGGLSLYVAMALARVLKVYVYETLVDPSNEKESIWEIISSPYYLLTQYLIWCSLVPLITVMMLIIINHLREQSRIAELEKEMNLAELKALQAQIHPHFLFNTLNNVYSLAVQKSPKTAEVAGRLHMILDYMFNRYEDRQVKIQDEIKLLQNYIELERIRYADRLNINFNINVDNDQFSLSPLILLTLVENAFKHGASKEIAIPSMSLNLNVKDGMMVFEIINTKPTSSSLSSDSVDIHSGIGLKNIQRQLELVYQDDYTLNLVDRHNQYEARLTLRRSLTNILVPVSQIEAA